MTTIDFQKNLETPDLFHSNVYYLRQLPTYSFGIHDCVATQGYLCLWDETMGSSEVASCLHKFFTYFRSGAR